MVKTLFLSSLVFNFGIILGRLSGFAREAFVASTLGVSSEADIVVLMLTVPDLLVNILMGGALGAVLVPEFSQKSLESSKKLLYQSLLFLGLVFTGVTVGLYWQAGLLIDMLAPGFVEAQKEEASIAIRWVLWLIPLTVLAGVVTAYLHSKNRFFVAASGTLIVNSAIIIGLVIAELGDKSLFVVAIFVLIGGTLRLLSQLLQVKIKWSPFVSLRPNQLHRSLLTRYGQAVVSGSILLLFPVVARAIASYQGDGSIALFNYATRLIELPLLIAITFLATVFFPRLAQSFSKDLILHKKLIKYGVQMTVALSLVASITLIFMSEAYIKSVYGYGVMTSSNLKEVEELVKIGLLALPLQGLSSFFTATFNARRDTRTPLLINGMGFLFFGGINYIGVFDQELEGLMWAIVASYGVICCLQLIFLKVHDLIWWKVFFEKTFLAGMISGLILLIYASKLIERVTVSPFLILALTCIVALISLFVMALFNKDIRFGLKVRMQ